MRKSNIQVQYQGGDKSKNYIGIDEELKVKEELMVGSKVILLGQHEGHSGKVLSMNEQIVTVELSMNGEIVKAK